MDSVVCNYIVKGVSCSITYGDPVNQYIINPIAGTLYNRKCPTAAIANGYIARYRDGPLPVAVALIVQVLLAKLAVTEMFAVTLESILGLAVALSLQLMKW
jgi:hypothetical protein